MEFSLNVFLLQLVTFLLGMWLSSKIFLPYLKGWMDSRQKKIEDQLSNAQRLQKEAEVLRADLDKKMKDLENSTSDILRKTREESVKARDEILENSHKAAERILADARRSVENERQAVVAALQREVGALAVSIAEKIIRSSVDAKAQDKMIQESLKELQGRKN